MDYLSLGPVPSSEDCAQLGAEDYGPSSVRECTEFIGQLIRQHGEPPMGARLTRKAFPHDFGTYHEVCVIFDEASEDAVAYAYRLEAETPETWDAAAVRELHPETATA